LAERRQQRPVRLPGAGHPVGAGWLAEPPHHQQADPGQHRQQQDRRHPAEPVVDDDAGPAAETVAEVARGDLDPVAGPPGALGEQPADDGVGGDVLGDGEQHVRGADRDDRAEPRRDG
jgi:hypothetical protein